jgi:hypothetical protein
MKYLLFIFLSCLCFNVIGQSSWEGDQISVKNVYFFSPTYPSQTGWIDISRDNGSKYSGSSNSTEAYTNYGITKKPVGYVSNNVIKVGADFSIALCNNEISLEDLIIKGVASNGFNFPPQKGVVYNDLLRYRMNESKEILENEKVKYFEEFKINWYITTDQNALNPNLEESVDWALVGVSKNPLYVTHTTPIAAIPGHEDNSQQLYKTGKGYDYFESLLYISCNNADDKTSKVNITLSIWDAFTQNDVKNSKGENLYYYYRWDQHKYSTTTYYLLQNQDGQCYAWASLFIDLLKIHGIDQANDLVHVRAPGGTSFLINDWTTLDPILKYPSVLCEQDNAYSFVTDLGGEVWDNIGNHYFYDFFYSEIVDETGVMGQNAPNPDSWFQEHCIVYLDFMDMYYDPSYGKTYSSIEQFQLESIAMWVCGPNLTEESNYELYDPDHNNLEHYDFDGDGLLESDLHEYRAYTDKLKYTATTQIFDR